MVLPFILGDEGTEVSVQLRLNIYTTPYVGATCTDPECPAEFIVEEAFLEGYDVLWHLNEESAQDIREQALSNFE